MKMPSYLENWAEAYRHPEELKINSMKARACTPCWSFTFIASMPAPWRLSQKLFSGSSWLTEQMGFLRSFTNPWTQWPVAKWSWENKKQLESATYVPSVGTSQLTVSDKNWEDLRTRQNALEVGIDQMSTCKTYPSCTRSGTGWSLS